MNNVRNVMILILVAFTHMSAQAGEISALVKKQLSVSGSSQVLIVMKSQADLDGLNVLDMPREQRIATVYETLVKHANETQKNVITFLNNKKIKHRRFFISNAILLEQATAETIGAIAKMPEVSKVLGNPSVALKLPMTVERLQNPLSGVGDNITSTGAERVWKELGITGQNIVVAGQDTGYQWDHPALKNHYRGWNGTTASHDYNWHDSIHKTSRDLTLKENICGYDLDIPCDDDKHGTHTMGTVVGSDGAENQVGMAPGAKWMGCRNMDGGAGTPASYLECFQFFLAPTTTKGDPFTAGKPAMAPHVINNSWGCPSEEGCSGDEILPALKAMKAAGIIVVASAGNDGPDCSTIKDPPAYHASYVLSVGAMNHRNGQIASFSSRGPSTFDGGVGPDVVAPGVSIRSSVPGSKYDQAMWSGTSMAGPHVVGQVALMLSAQPKLIGKVDKLISMVRATAENTSSNETCGGVSGGTIPNNTYGYGKIRVFDSVKAAMAASL